MCLYLSGKLGADTLQNNQGRAQVYWDAKNSNGVVLAESVEQIVGRQIRERRARLGWSLDQLASIADLDLGHLRAIEDGAQRAPVKELVQLCTALRLSLGELFRDFMDGHDVDVTCQNARAQQNSTNDAGGLDDTVPPTGKILH